MERIPSLPEWAFRRGELVTVNPIRREKLEKDWVGDESNGLPEEKLDATHAPNVSIEEQLNTF